MKYKTSLTPTKTPAAAYKYLTWYTFSHLVNDFIYDIPQPRLPNTSTPVLYSQDVSWCPCQIVGLTAKRSYGTCSFQHSLHN